MSVNVVNKGLGIRRAALSFLSLIALGLSACAVPGEFAAAANSAEFPCGLLSESEVSQLIDDPGQGEKNSKGGCTWESTTMDGDAVQVVYPVGTATFNAAKTLGRGVDNLGDKAFIQATKISAGSESRSVVQARLFVSFDKKIFTLIVRADDPPVEEMIELAGDLIERLCDTCPGVAKTPKPEPTLPAGQIDPCSLLTTEEVNNVVGPTEAGKLTSSDTPGCEWAGANLDVNINQWDLDSFETIRTLERFAPITSIGDEAYSSGGPEQNQVVFLKGERVFALTLFRAGNESMAQQLATIVAVRV